MASEKKSCFGRWYLASAVECRQCKVAEACRRKSPRQPIEVKQGPVCLAILHSLENGELLFRDLKKAVVLAIAQQEGNQKGTSLHYHLNLLKRKGRVVMRRRGAKVWYKLSKWDGGSALAEGGKEKELC